jgi:hypothetical protein
LKQSGAIDSVNECGRAAVCPLTYLEGFEALVVVHEEALRLLFVLSVLEVLVDGQSEVVSTRLLRLELVELIGLDVDNALGTACGNLSAQGYRF